MKTEKEVNDWLTDKYFDHSQSAVIIEYCKAKNISIKGINVRLFGTLLTFKEFLNWFEDGVISVNLPVFYDDYWYIYFNEGKQYLGVDEESGLYTVDVSDNYCPVNTNFQLILISSLNDLIPGRVYCNDFHECAIALSENEFATPFADEIYIQHKSDAFREENIYLVEKI